VGGFEIVELVSLIPGILGHSRGGRENKKPRRPSSGGIPSLR